MVIPPIGSVQECDRRLMACYAAYVLALDSGDDESAFAAYELIDELLDRRLTAPHRARRLPDTPQGPGCLSAAPHATARCCPLPSSASVASSRTTPGWPRRSASTAPAATRMRRRRTWPCPSTVSRPLSPRHAANRTRHGRPQRRPSERPCRNCRTQRRGTGQGRRRVERAWRECRRHSGRCHGDCRSSHGLETRTDRSQVSDRAAPQHTASTHRRMVTG